MESAPTSNGFLSSAQITVVNALRNWITVKAVASTDLLILSTTSAVRSAKENVSQDSTRALSIPADLVNTPVSSAKPGLRNALNVTLPTRSPMLTP